MRFIPADRAQPPLAEAVLVRKYKSLGLKERWSRERDLNPQPPLYESGQELSPSGTQANDKALRMTIRTA